MIIMVIISSSSTTMVVVVLVFLPLLINYKLYTFIELKIKENENFFFIKIKAGLCFSYCRTWP